MGPPRWRAIGAALAPPGGARRGGDDEWDGLPNLKKARAAFLGGQGGGLLREGQRAPGVPRRLLSEAGR
eukprot:3999655-Pyramimonas_sp.AAC.1